MKKISLFHLCVFVILGFSMIFLVQCGQKNKKTEISIIGETTSTIEALMSVEKEYERLNPNIDLIFHPNTFDDAFNKINQDFANHTGLYDIVMQYNFSLSSFVRNNYVYNPNELMEGISQEFLSFEADLFDKTWKTVGHYYNDFKDPSKGIQKVGYPYVANSILLMYNKEMFENEETRQEFQSKYGFELAPPNTWEEFYKVAEFFTNDKKGTKGVCLEGASGSMLYFEFANYLHSMGGKVLEKELGWEGDANTPVVLNSPESLKALQFFRSLKPFNRGNFIDVEQFKEMQFMLEGKTAMSLSWEDVISMKVQNEPDFSNKFGFAPIPGEKSVIGGGAFFINRDSKHPKEAFEFIIYLMQKSTQKELALKGLSTPLESVYDIPEVKEVAHMNALKESLQRGGIYLEAGPASDMIAETLSTYIQRVWNDELTAEEALEKAHEEISIKRAEIYKKLN